MNLPPAPKVPFPSVADEEEVDEVLLNGPLFRPLSLVAWFASLILSFAAGFFTGRSW